MNNTKINLSAINKKWEIYFIYLLVVDNLLPMSTKFFPNILIMLLFQLPIVIEEWKGLLYF